MSVTPVNVSTAFRRAAGVVLHPTSLPGPFGIGDFGTELRDFLSWMARSGLTIWQILPLNPTGCGNSPYSCLSSFAGNPLLISPVQLQRDKLLPRDSLESTPPLSVKCVDYQRVATYKMALLRRSFAHFDAYATTEQRRAFEIFVNADEQSYWLDDWALFMALRHQCGDTGWSLWDDSLALRHTAALSAARDEMFDEIRFHKYVQFLFFRQWRMVLDDAHALGIQVIGDLPIYVASDSADVWVFREFFNLDDRGVPTVVSGVPPDKDFNPTGQRWGHPLFRWDVMRECSYRWWIDRLRGTLQHVDFVRLDHFCGYAKYWEIAAKEPRANKGHWRVGPGKSLCDAIRGAFGNKPPLVVEDLGFLTRRVDSLRHALSAPGMRVLQFAFRRACNPHLPHCYEPTTIAYTSTHDTNTARGWFQAASRNERLRAMRYLGSDHANIARSMIRAIYTSVASIAIATLQDLLGEGAEARMNTPGTVGNNWTWRYSADALSASNADSIRGLVRAAGRLPRRPAAD